MAWQSTFNRIFGPGLFAGISAGDWFRLLQANRFAVHPRFALRCLIASGASLGNSINLRLEQWKYGRRFMQETVPPPLFILGHWRSGTTHLHNLLSRDERYAFPNLYQVLYPHTFLTTEAVNSRLLSLILPRTRFGIDNVEISWRAPYEDEFTIATMTQLSPYVTMAFPRRHNFYDRFLTLAHTSPEEIGQWKAAMMTFLKKLTFKYHRPLILKSPGHTCRIRLLLELFPDAKFIHIRRNPFEVFQSMKKMISASLRFWHLQDSKCVDWEERTIRQYREMYDAYFGQRRLIPDGHLHEMSFEALEADPLAQLRRIYEALDLPAFQHFEPKLHEYLNTLHGYQRNRLPQLSSEMCERLTREWSACFETWDYPTACYR